MLFDTTHINKNEIPLLPAKEENSILLLKRFTVNFYGKQLVAPGCQ